ncbi:hypothetical protein [Tianweitania sediminis]|uniref:DUF2946 domain-containing protein n=1 Tax=Tianweitania sediminis TaxID=1502156 RepID=A0A8J7R571_9HYPH|nr:hypothetical protein [Tianweitania sediminis]MBP0441121.1 hypothetical protein [Tianweitania sediminis]
MALRAMAVTWLIVLSMLAGAFSAGAAPLGPQLDAFGNPLCLPSQENGSHAGHGALPGCCVLSCCAELSVATGPSTPIDLSFCHKILDRLALQTRDAAPRLFLKGARHARGPPLFI